MRAPLPQTHVAGLAVALLALAACERQPLVDLATGCLAGQPPPATTAILADGTDPWTPSQAARLRAAMEEERRRLPDYGRLIVAIVTPDAPLEPQVVVSRCRPPDGSQESIWNGNPDIVRAGWRRTFIRPLDRAITRLLNAPPADRSPIMESISALTWRADFSGAVPNRRLRIVSDLLQNGPDFTFYGGQGSWARFEGSRLARELEPVLGGVDVRIDYLRRENALAAQGPGHRAFWTRWLTSRGARTPTFAGEADAAAIRPQLAEANARAGAAR